MKIFMDSFNQEICLAAVAIACCYRYEWPCLVITPSSLRHDWAEAFKKWAGSAVDPWKVKVIEKTQELKQKASIFIISYTLATNAIEELQKKLFKVIIAVRFIIVVVVVDH